MNKERKSFWAGILCTLIIFGMIGSVSAITGKKTQEVQYNNIGVILNGNRLDLVDAKGNSVEPFMYNNTNYLPVRAIAEALGLSVEWDTEENAIRLSTILPDKVSVKVTRVIDGDTFVVDYNGTEEKVRLIGIDTPESVHPDSSKNTEEGKIASEYTKSQLDGKTVELEFDVQQRDKYGRLLAYAYINGKMYNETLLENGYATIATYPPNIKYVDRFTEIANKKTDEENKDTPSETTGTIVYITKTGKRYHFNSNCNGGTYYTTTLSEAKNRGLTPCSKCAH